MNDDDTATPGVPKLPVRMLNDFYIYENHDGRRVMQRLDDYDSQSTRLHAVGRVTPYFVDTDANDDDDFADEKIIRTSAIRDLYVQYLEYDRYVYTFKRIGCTTSSLYLTLEID